MKIENDILIPQFAALLREHKEVRFTPSGVSMRPFIEGDRDSVILAALDRAPRVGDILLAQVANMRGQKTYVLHRLIRVEKNENEWVYVLRGDGNCIGEEQCALPDIIGRVIAIERPSGRRKCLTRGRLWQLLFPLRRYLLKIYRHTIVKWYY